jgi:hypothetical protein
VEPGGSIEETAKAEVSSARPGPRAGQRHGTDLQGTCEIPLASTGAMSRNTEHRLTNCSRPDGNLSLRREPGRARMREERVGPRPNQ